MQTGRFADAHRAMADVIALIHLLAHRLSHGGTVIGDLLANAERPTIRVEATGAAFEKRGVLKGRATAGMRASASGGARSPRSTWKTRRCGWPGRAVSGARQGPGRSLGTSDIVDRKKGGASAPPPI